MSEHNLPPASPPPAPSGDPLPPAAPSNPGKPTSTMAIVSLIAGILGWTFVPWLGSIVAVIAGHMARGEIRRSQGALDGDPLAVIGLVLGWSMLVLSVLTVLAVIFFFGGLAVLLGLVGLGSQI